MCVSEYCKPFCLVPRAVNRARWERPRGKCADDVDEAQVRLAALRLAALVPAAPVCAFASLIRAVLTRALNAAPVDEREALVVRRHYGVRRV